MTTDSSVPCSALDLPTNPQILPDSWQSSGSDAIGLASVAESPMRFGQQHTDLAHECNSDRLNTAPLFVR